MHKYHGHTHRQTHRVTSWASCRSQKVNLVLKLVQSSLLTSLLLTDSHCDYCRMTKWVTTIPWQCPLLTIYNKTRLISFTSCRIATSNSDFQLRWIAYVSFFHDCEGRLLIRFLSMDLLRHQRTVFLFTTQDITYHHWNRFDFYL